MLSPRTIKVLDVQGAFEVKVSKPVKACDIIEAQAKLHLFDASFQVCIDGQPLDHEDYIPAHVQTVEMKRRPIARSLALPIASSQRLPSPTTTAGTENASSRKQTLTDVEGYQADSSCPVPHACNPNPCSTAIRTSQAQAPDCNVSQFLGQVQHREIPVIYQPNGEAMLLTGSLINLGDEPVALAQGTIAEPSALATGVCKVTISRDELPLEWEKITQGPVKWLIQAVPATKVCSGIECGIDCLAFHPASEEKVDQMILDLWSRQYQTLDGKRAEPAKADVFGVLLRVPKSAVDQLQVVQHAGVYVEPRAEEGAGPNEEYSGLVWMPTATKDAARHIVRTALKAISAARLGTKFGIRTKDCDEEALFNLLRPNVPFAKAAASRRFRVHPLLHGTQRADLIKLLREWNWCARPLQPCRGDSQGAARLVGSDAVPGLSALPTGCGFAIATPLSPGNAKPDVGTQLYASQRTRRCIQKEQAASSKTNPRGEDPWLNSLDPWAAHNANKTAALQAKPSSGQSRIAAIEDSLLKQVNNTAQEHVATEVQAQLAQHGKATDERFARLVSGLQEVQQNAKLQEWLGTVNRQVAQTTGELQEVQMGLSSQEAAINGVRQEVQQQSANTQATIQSVQSTQVTFSQQIAALFQGHMEQFQTLLAKRKHSE